MILKVFLLFFFCLIINGSYSQAYKAMVYDLKSRKIDSIFYTNFDTTKNEDRTDFYVGKYNNNYNQLEMSLPTDNIWNDIQFTLKQKVSDKFTLEDFPIRTSIKLFRMENDTLKQTCSGSIISGRHILTAAHCILDYSKDSLKIDSLMVSPVFDNGEFSDIFDCSWVNKVYTFRNSIPSREDFAILELEKPLGIKTGWISIGYNNDDPSLGEGIFYKFSYPGRTMLMLDSNEYNGDTLFFTYGKVDYFNKNSVGVQGYHNGIPGESGSSIIKIQNYDSYITYGVLSFSGNLTHSRITNRTFYAIKSIIEEDLDLNNFLIEKDDLFVVYPNPSAYEIWIDSPIDIEIQSCSLFNSLGYKLFDIAINTLPRVVDISYLAQGIYIIKINSGNNNITKKIMKSGG